MFRKKSSNSKKAQERVIIGEEIVDLATLRSEAKSAGTRFWVLLVLVSLISSMVVPYLSMASIAASDTNVFNGDVIPGYSMGGMPIAAYGVDINSWGQSGKQSDSNPAIAKSQYGYWTAKRAEDASRNLVASRNKDKDEKGADLYDYKIDDDSMTDEEKAKGWIGITRAKGEGIGLSGFSNGGNGYTEENRKDYNEAVAPYRTQADWKFWDSQTVGGQGTNMIATIYPDFVIFGWDAQNNTARTLTNPDDIQNSTNSEGATTALAGTAAVPHYVPLSTLFEEFGLGDAVMGKDGTMNNMDALFDAIVAEAQKPGNDGKSPTLNKIVKNEGNDPKYDLMLGTHYDNLNGENKSTEKGSDAWNPYPYSMVFKTDTESGTVVSSIYNNTEAYVYLSPMAAYNTYMGLRSEYDSIINVSATQVAEAQPQAAFQLGYYLAGMSILEAYLSEALPQDMTRGYVGPTEGNPIASSTSALSDAKKLDTRSGTKGTVADLFAPALTSVDGMYLEDKKNDSAVGFRAVPYSQLMYDFADSAIVKNGASGEGTWLGTTSAIMNTLSTYGYGVRDSGQNVNTEKSSAGQGPNRGMTRRQAMARVTSFGPHTRNAESLNVSISDDKDDPMLHPEVANAANTGFYIPTYYPIQQHEMPADKEMPYRFQVLSLIPYDTFAYELGEHGFNSKVTLSYNNNAILRIDPTKNYYSKVSALAKQLDDLNNGTGVDSLAGFEKGRSIALNPQDNSTTMVGEKSTQAYAQDRDLTERVDNALMSFTSELMNADNVHDLVDIMRAVPGVKYETFVRYYNPIKSSGGTHDIFLTRITPAQTTYMPSILTSGYESAGGITNNANATSTATSNFDYFSIPSFAPCFAAKTSSDTYYGVLNYELRPFYTAGFLSSLPASTNIPALEQFEEVKDEEEQQKITNAVTGMKTKILTIYVLAKRLAFATAYEKLVSRDGSVSAGALYYADESQASLEPTDGVSASEVKEALKPADATKYMLPPNDDGTHGFASVKTDEALDDSVERHGEGDNRIDESYTTNAGDSFGLRNDGGTGQVSFNSNVYQAEFQSADDDTITHVYGVSSEEEAEIVRTQETWREEEAERERQRQLEEQMRLAQSYYEYADVDGDYTYIGDDDYGYGYWDDDSDSGFLDQVSQGVVAVASNAISSGGAEKFHRWEISRFHLDETPDPPQKKAYVTGTTYYSTGAFVTNYAYYSIAPLVGGSIISYLSDFLSYIIPTPTVAYADTPSDAQSVYEKDRLSDKGYKKGTSQDWKDIVGDTTIQNNITFHIPSDLDLPTSGDFDYVMHDFGQKHILSDDTLGKKVVWCKMTSSGLSFTTDVKTIFSALYNDAYIHYLAPDASDSYYWDTPATIAQYDVQIDRDYAMKSDEKTSYGTVALVYSDATNAEKAKTELDAYCEKAFEEMEVMLENVRMLNDTLPKQMQNVVAWADAQTSSESEANYQTDPSDNTLHINLGVKEREENIAPTVLHNLYEAQKMGFIAYDNGGDYALGRPDIPETGVADPSRQARIIRGVAGTTATASQRLAAYTISATVGRIERLAPSSASSLSIPYAGIYNGDLNAGTDRYAQLQAHTIDRQSIATGLTGDLRNRGSESVQVSTANPSSDLDTQNFVKVQGTLVSEFSADVVPNSIEVMQDAMSRTMPSDTTPTKTIKDATADTRGFSLPDFLGSGGTDKVMANVSTFGGATMNRQSALVQTYNPSAQHMVYQTGGIATASASSVTQNRQWAESLVDGTFSDTYAVIQSVALIMVLAFLMIIAFQNFVGYTSGKEKDYIEAQTKLKTVLPRSLIAVAMIGLPPIGGGLGFQGGCFLLLQVLNAIMDSLLGMFTNGSDTFNVLMTSIGESMRTAFNLGDIFDLFNLLLELFAAILFFLGSIFIMLLCTATDVVLFLFWMVGPLVWAFYVWPYDASHGSKASSRGGIKGLLGKATGYMGLKSFTNGDVGRDAPTGWVMGYLSSLSTIAIWSLMFMGFSVILTMMRTGSNVTDAAAQVASTQSQAGPLGIGEAHLDPTSSIYDPGSASDAVSNGIPMLPDNGVGHLILALLFLVVTYIMFRIFKNSMTGAMKFMYGTVGAATKIASTIALGHVAAAAKGANFAAKASEFAKVKDLAGSPVGSVLDKAINVGAQGLDGALHGIGSIDNIVNSPAASDVGSRMNKLIDAWSADVDKRPESSGAFEGLVSTREAIDEDGNVRHVAEFTPAISGVADVGRRATKGYKDLRLQHHKNKTKKQLAELANKDNDWHCLQRYDAVRDRLGSSATGNMKDDIAALSQDVRGRLAAAPSMGEPELEALRKDAKLLGIGDRQLDSMMSGNMSEKKLDKQFAKASENTMEVLSRAAAIEGETGGRERVEKQHETLEARRSAIEARAMGISQEFGNELMEYDQALAAQGALTKDQQVQRSVQVTSDGMLQQAGTAVGIATGAHVAGEIAKGGRLGDKESGSLSTRERNAYNAASKRMGEETQEVRRLAQAAAGANMAFDKTDDELPDVAQDEQSTEVAALDTLLRHRSEEEAERTSS